MEYIEFRIREIEYNPFFEICRKDYSHPYRHLPCDRYCPDWELCSRGEWFENEHDVQLPLNEEGRLVREIIKCLVNSKSPKMIHLAAVLAADLETKLLRKLKWREGEDEDLG